MRKRNVKRPDVRNRNCFNKGPKHPSWKGGIFAWKARMRKRSRANRAVARWLVLWYYSKGDPRCICCNENTVEFLAVNHVDGGGRKEFKKWGGELYIKIAEWGFPDGYNVLCHNCNMAIGLYGECPHGKRKRKQTRRS